MLKQSISVILSLFILNSALGAPTPELCDPDTFHQMKIKFVKHVDARIHSTSRPFLSYHWGSLRRNTVAIQKAEDGSGFLRKPQNRTYSYDETMGFKSKQAANRGEKISRKAPRYFQDLASGFLTQSEHWQAGQGLYAAVDPVQSEEYGTENDFMVMEIETPAKTRYLDLTDRKNEKIPFTDAEAYCFYAKVMKYKGEQLSSSLKFPTPPLSAIRISSPALSLVIDLFRERKVSFILYDWSEYRIPVCEERNENRKIAFLFMNANLVKAPGFKIHAFTQTLDAKKLDADERFAARRILSLSEYVLISELNDLTDDAARTKRPLVTIDPSDLTKAAYRLRQWHSVLGSTDLLQRYFPHYFENLEALRAEWERLPVGKPWTVQEHPVIALSADRLKTDLKTNHYQPQMFTMAIETAEKYLWECRETDKSIIKTSD